MKHYKIIDDPIVHNYKFTNDPIFPGEVTMHFKGDENMNHTPERFDRLYYHAHCPDGAMCNYIATAASKVSRTSLSTFPVTYMSEYEWEFFLREGQFKENEEICFADFTPPLNVMCKILDSGARLTVIDHHQTALVDIQRAEVYARETGGIFTYRFDSTRCGSAILWEFVTGTEAPMIVKYVQDRDLWKWELPESKEFSEGFYSISLSNPERVIEALLDKMMFNGYSLVGADVGDCIKVGRILLKSKQDQVLGACSDKKRITFGQFLNYDVAMICSSTNISEIGNQLCLQYPIDFAIVYFDFSGYRKFSLRSVGDFDVSAIAARFKGGGGHKNAAGFEVRIDPVMLMTSPFSFGVGWNPALEWRVDTINGGEFHGKL